MAELKHISSRLSLTISLGEVEGKTETKSLSLSNIGAAATADILAGLASVMGELLEYPVASVRKYDTELLETA